uniref:Protein SEC13 homolog n=1 Tax=Meloidogyne javanica TaxID=6303 RepID=A0A915M8G1_MELJA
VSLTSRVETGHRDIIHDAQMNYYGTRLATCSSDHLVKIFEIKANGQSLPIAELTGHDGPVWQVSWAPPKFDNVLASCSHDRKAIIWREVNGKWQKSGCNAISWAHAKRIKSVLDKTEKIDPKRFVTGGNDRLVKIWRVRDVAWSPSDSLTSTIASCGVDGQVIIWRCSNLDSAEDPKWTSRLLRKYDDPLWHVSWSLCATVLAVSGADNKVNLFQERLPNQWIQISEPDEDK